MSTIKTDFPRPKGLSGCLVVNDDEIQSETVIQVNIRDQVDRTPLWGGSHIGPPMTWVLTSYSMAHEANQWHLWQSF